MGVTNIFSELLPCYMAKGTTNAGKITRISSVKLQITCGLVWV